MCELVENPSYLSRLFKKETGVSFLDFVKEDQKAEEAEAGRGETDDKCERYRKMDRLFGTEFEPHVQPIFKYVTESIPHASPLRKTPCRKGRLHFSSA